jgi:uncharacterized protein (DUF433 family)
MTKGDDVPRSRKTPLSFRVRAETVKRLAQRAREAGETQTALVERYVEEGLRLDAHPLVYFREGAGGRRPALMGTRLDVAQVVETVRQNDNSVDDAAEYLGLPPERVQACLRYYAEFQNEVDDWQARRRAIAEREEANWQRQQEILA